MDKEPRMKSLTIKKNMYSKIVEYLGKKKRTKEIQHLDLNSILSNIHKVVIFLWKL